MKFKNYVQYDIMDCGPTCLKMIAHYYGKTLTLETLRKKTSMSKFGVSLHGISEAAEEIGFTTTGAIVSYQQLIEEVTLPAIAHWQQNHFVVIYQVTKNKVFISDPAQGNKTYTKNEFLKLWGSKSDDNEIMGIILLLEPTIIFYNLENEKDVGSRSGFAHLFLYIKKYKKEIFYVLFAIGLSSVLQFIFPFLTQSIVDSGIANKDIHIVGLILLAQFAMLLGRFFIEFVRTWLLLFVNTRVNVAILSDFLIKLMKLPVSYFDTKMSGDILQRMNDHRRIQDFLSGPSLEIVFSLTTIVVLGITLFIYDKYIFLVFIVSSVIYTLWTLVLLKRRTRLDFKRFELNAQNQSETIQIIDGIQEIKLNNSEKIKRWRWEKIQSKLFKLNIDSLRYQQIQQSGAFIINDGKNLLITYIAASNVITNGDFFTLGKMLAVQVIVGQLNGPISLLINLIQSYHDTRLSLERLNEVQHIENEEITGKSYITEYPEKRDIRIDNLTFAYPGTEENVLQELGVTIPQGKTTAIVGPSGSGKTTLLKILLQFYTNYKGEIKLGDFNLTDISPKFWRSKCGTVMQDGFIFSDSIANNIAVSDDQVDWTKLDYALKTANINEFINTLPLGVNTRIGGEGMGISQGQKQRILIARAVYKNPDFIFFDEATNALDANNERIIIENLESFFTKKTVIVVAHRLSTVKNADQIIVLDKGKITEAGSHEELTKKKGSYYTLVKNQLELGS
jgi:ATP-binding cassette, subfamily B, bacterial